MRNPIGALRRITTLLAVVIVAGVLALSVSTPTAHADGNGGLDYSTGGRGVRHLGTWAPGSVTVDTTYLAKRWPVGKAIARLESRTGLDLRRAACASDLAVQSCVTTSSARGATEGRTRALVSLWSEGDRLVAADVAIDDRDTRKWGKAKRLRMLCAYLGRGAGLTKPAALSACR